MLHRLIKCLRRAPIRSLRPRRLLTVEQLERRELLSAAPFALYGTGLDGSGHLLADGISDAHYRIVSGPSTAAPAVLPQGNFPFPYWTGDDDFSKWITPGDALGNAGNGYQEPEGDYDYQTTFNLSGYDPTTAAIHGLIGADNRIVEVKLNGVDVAGYAPTDASASDFAALRSLNITSGFMGGVNTLDFVVHNDPGDSWNPTGFRAQLSGTAQLLGTPFNVYGTGVDDNGNLLADGASDPHYQVVSGPDTGPAGAPFVTIQNGFPFTAWTADGPNSKWISPNANENDYAGGVTEPTGDTTYETTFDLTGFDPSTAHIAGYVSADDTLTQVLLNGQDVGWVSSGGSDYTSMHPITFDQGFVAGVNTLDFVVHNIDLPAHDPSAFRAELQGAADKLAWQGPTFTWTAQPSTPSLVNPGAQLSAEGQAVSLQVQATGPDNDPLTYAAAGLPNGLSINPQTGLISGTLDYSAAEESGAQYSVYVLVYDSNGMSAAQSFPWTVTDTHRPPVLTNPGSQSNTDGDDVDLQVQATQPDGDSITYSDSGTLPPGLAIDSQTGDIAGTISSSADLNAPYTVTITATSQGGSASQTFTWSVSAATPAPVALDDPGDQIGLEGTPVSLQLSASSSQDEVLTYSADDLPPGLSINSSTGLISGTLTAGYNGGAWVTVTASDGTNSASQSFAWEVTPQIAFTPVNDQTNVEGDSIDLQVSATAAGGGTVSYAASGLPAGLSIDPATGLISGTVNTGDSTGSPYLTTITGTDGTYSNTLSIAWTVQGPDSQPPILTDPGDQTSVVGANVSLAISASDPNGYALTFAAVGLPDGLNIDPSSGTISGTVSEDGVSSAPYAVTVSATDSNSQTASDTFDWTISDSNLSVQGAPQTVAEGTDLLGTPLFTFTDTDAARTDLYYQANINWGDGQTGLGIVSSSGAGSFQVTGDHTYTQPGSYTATVTLMDEVGGTATASSAVTVTAQLTAGTATPIVSVVGAPVNGLVATFTDANPYNPAASYTATIHWGDGTVSPGQVLGDHGQFEVVIPAGIPHTYSTAGLYSLAVNVTNPDGTTVTTTDSVTVGDMYAGEATNLRVATITGADPSATYTAIINWGDNTTSAGTVTIATDGTGQVTGTHTYLTAGNFTAQVQVMNGAGVQLLSAQAGIQVVNVALGVPANIPFVLNALNQLVQLRASLFSGNAFGLPVVQHLGLQVQLQVGANVLKTWRFELLGYNEAGQNAADRLGYGPFGPAGYFNSIAAAWANPLYQRFLANSPFLQNLSNLSRQNLGVDFPLAWSVFNGAAEMFLRGSLRRAYGIYLSSTTGQGAVTPLGQISALQLLQLVLSTVNIAGKASTAGFFLSTPGSTTTVTDPGLAPVLVNMPGRLIDVTMQTGLGYDPLSRNSNTFIGTILRAAGLANGVPPPLRQISVGFYSTFTNWTLADLALQIYISNQARAAGL